jgi:hypothetical protein
MVKITLILTWASTQLKVSYQALEPLNNHSILVRQLLQLISLSSLSHFNSNIRSTLCSLPREFKTLWILSLSSLRLISQLKLSYNSSHNNTCLMGKHRLHRHKGQLILKWTNLTKAIQMSILDHNLIMEKPRKVRREAHPFKSRPPCLSPLASSQNQGL